MRLALIWHLSDHHGRGLTLGVPCLERFNPPPRFKCGPGPTPKQYQSYDKRTPKVDSVAGWNVCLKSFYMPPLAAYIGLPLQPAEKHPAVKRKGTERSTLPNRGTHTSHGWPRFHKGFIYGPFLAL